MSSQQVVALLVALAAIVALANVMGRLATRLAQPAVVGEILAGVLVGPTLFGGAVADLVFPADIRPMLSSLANVGLVFFMFLVGLEFNRDLLRERLGAITVLSLGSMLTPFVLGVLLATALRPDDDRVAFVLYLGTAMAVTAFPVLARMIGDWNLSGSKVGVLALGSAALGDLLAWSMLAVAIATLGVGTSDQWRLLLVLPLALVGFLVVRPLLARIADSRRDMFAVVLIGLLGWSALTEWMGLHFIFGAFLFGLVMPHGTDLRAGVTLRIEQVGKVLLLPVYFVVAGLNVDLSRITWSGFADFGLILLVAVGGKFAGAVLAARLCRLGWRESATLGTLLNTRGLTELVILSIGLQLGLLDRDLYSQLVLMAVLTTMMTGPLVTLLHREREPELVRV
ncbi:cation:proton antiporter [Actinosynnema sp. NPDC047251]|uniref:Na+/H+ antiporter n=1 Tax=Saccharothrix espanaensis (strain ATCC 51144 / DSM 44229 / JCM 9112 / NBRC 15066 / NRRL 15764) TaxID=1179773 RepID=K0JZL1_SACES|nr:cation:proton antiporter [Saccharothrix espanaensis]CCH29723.1 Na+/H+ antiporter [Saccharothrix espanaensis DSM 44229]